MKRLMDGLKRLPEGTGRRARGIVGVAAALGAPLLATAALGLACALPAHSADDPWAGQTFLPDYSQLQPVPGKDGKDYVFFAPDAEQRAAALTRVMLDEPEVFISPDSPYKGAKAEDIAAIAGLVRGAIAASLTKRGYALVDQPGPDVVYVRTAVTDLRIAKKKRGLLSYTPVGLVVNAGKQAVSGFLAKYDVLDMALQAEIQESTSGYVLAGSVLKRGKGAGASKPFSFDAMAATAAALGDRLACRLDNAHVPAAQRIDCTDQAAREARAKVTGK